MGSKRGSKSFFDTSVLACEAPALLLEGTKGGLRTHVEDTGGKVGNAGQRNGKARKPGTVCAQAPLETVHNPALKVLAADHSFEGLSVAEVMTALGMSLSEDSVRQALVRLVGNGQAFNTLSHEKFAAV